jgi:hypothetical protein
MRGSLPLAKKYLSTGGFYHAEWGASSESGHNIGSMQPEADPSSGRPDLVEKFAKAHPEARFVMAGADNGMLLGAMRAGAAKFKQIASSIQ